MGLENTDCARRFARLCQDGYEQGWHEANGGNLSYRLSAKDVTDCKQYFSNTDQWHPLPVSVPSLADAYFLVTGAGKFMRNMTLDLAANAGVVHIGPEGETWRVVWGLLRGAQPTSEFAAHLMCHSVRAAATDGADRIIYHAHCPNVVVLSTLIAPDTRTWTHALWSLMTESIIVFPRGIGVAPWMVPGSTELAERTCELMERHSAVAWTQHGMIVSGPTFDAAFGTMHTVEKACGMYLSCRAASGGSEPSYLISREHLEAVAARYDLDVDESLLP